MSPGFLLYNDDDFGINSMILVEHEKLPHLPGQLYAIEEPVYLRLVALVLFLFLFFLLQ